MKPKVVNVVAADLRLLMAAVVAIAVAVPQPNMVKLQPVSLPYRYSAIFSRYQIAAAKLKPTKFVAIS